MPFKLLVLCDGIHSGFISINDRHQQLLACSSLSLSLSLFCHVKDQIIFIHLLFSFFHRFLYICFRHHYHRRVLLLTYFFSCSNPPVYLMKLQLNISQRSHSHSCCQNVVSFNHTFKYHVPFRWVFI
jgi:hypothetical protein